MSRMNARAVPPRESSLITHFVPPCGPTGASQLWSMTTLHLVTRTLFRVSALRRSFGADMLGLRLPEDGGSVRVDHFDSNQCSMTFNWPAWLCRADGQLCLASALAACDEASTFGLAAWDARHRPGVSVTLSGQRVSHAPVRAGEPLTFNSRLIKGGQTLAWLHIDVSNADGEVLATGRHLKFQSTGMPPGWDIVAHPLLRPALYSAVRHWHTRLAESTPPPFPASDASRRENLSMTASADSSAADPFLTSAPLLSNTAAPSAFTATMTRKYGNPGGTLHGGCAAMLCDETAAASYCAALGTDAPPAVQRMHVSLLGAVDVAKPRLVETSAVTSAVQGRAHATLRVPGKATPAVEADIWW